MNKIFNILFSFIFVFFMMNMGPKSQAHAKGAHSSSSTNGMQGLISVGANVAMGGQMMSAFSASCPIPCLVPLLVMGLLSFAQAGGSGDAAGESFNAADMTNLCPECFGGLTDINELNDNAKAGVFALDPSMSLDNGPYSNVGELQNAMKDLAGKIKETGYKIDLENKKIIDPNGKETSFSAANDMISNGTGLSDSEHSAVKKALLTAQGKLNSKYRVSAVKFDSGGAGGNSSFKFEPVETSDPFADYFKRRQELRKPASVSGFTRIIQGEAIGVNGENIFDMIHRRYQEKRKKNIFNENTAPNVNNFLCGRT